MLFNLLGAYREYMTARLGQSTAKTYYDRLCGLLADQSLIDTVNKMNFEKVLDKLSEIKYKNHFSQAKNSFLYFCEFQKIQIPHEVEKNIDKLEACTKRKYRKLKNADYRTIQEKINHIQNKKLRISYQTMASTGLRVSELSQITPKDCEITDDKISFSFIGKGGEKEVVEVEKREYAKTYQNIIELIGQSQEDERLFYSSTYLQAKANEFGFRCHDLRRAFAKIEYKKCKSKSEVSKKLRHSQRKTTDIYLKSRIDI